MANKKLVTFIAIVVAVLVLNFVFGWSDALFGSDTVAQLSSMVQQHPVQAALVYVLLSVLGSVVLALPGVVFALAAGMIFGALWGTVLCWASMSISACLAYLVGRYFLKDALKPQLAKSQALNKLLFEGAHKSDVYLLAVTRLIPIFPFNLQNFAYGITDVKFSHYAFYSALFILPGTAAYTIAFAGVTDEQNRVICFVLAAVLFVLSMGVAQLLKKKANVQ